MRSQTMQRHAIIGCLFGAGGAAATAASTDLVAFDDCIENYPKTVLCSAPANIQQYIDSRIIHLLRLNVLASEMEWTNNNAESVNHILKQVIQRRPQQLPDLIRKLPGLV